MKIQTLKYSKKIFITNDSYKLKIHQTFLISKIFIFLFHFFRLIFVITYKISLTHSSPQVTSQIQRNQYFPIWKIRKKKITHEIISIIKFSFPNSLWKKLRSIHDTKKMVYTRGGLKVKIRRNNISMICRTTSQLRRTSNGSLVPRHTRLLKLRSEGEIVGG